MMKDIVILLRPLPRPHFLCQNFLLYKVRLQDPPLDTVSSTRAVSAPTCDSFIARMMGDTPTPCLSPARHSSMRLHRVRYGYVIGALLPACFQNMSIPIDSQASGRGAANI
jgi:hypothetical protein